MANDGFFSNSGAVSFVLFPFHGGTDDINAVRMLETAGPGVATPMTFIGGATGVG
jgi:hypothetical protein